MDRIAAHRALVNEAGCHALTPEANSMQAWVDAEIGGRNRIAPSSDNFQLVLELALKLNPHMVQQALGERVDQVVPQPSLLFNMLTHGALRPLREIAVLLRQVWESSYFSPLNTPGGELFVDLDLRRRFDSWPAAERMQLAEALLSKIKRHLVEECGVTGRSDFDRSFAEFKSKVLGAPRADS